MNNISNIYEICRTVCSSTGHWCNILTSMHNIAGGTPAICKLKHKGNTDFPKPTPSSPSPMYPSISLFSPEATLPTEQPELFDVALRTANHKRLIPPNGTSGKAGERRSRKENAHEGFKEKTNCAYFKHCWVWFFFFFLVPAAEEQLQSWQVSIEVMKHFCTTALLWHLIDHVFPSFSLTWFLHLKHYSFKINHSIYTCLDFCVTVSTLPLSLFLSHCHWKTRNYFVPVVSILNFPLLYLL